MRNFLKKINRFFSNITGYQIIKSSNISYIDNFKNEPHLDKDFLTICSKINKIYSNDIINETNYTAFNIIKNILNQGLEGCVVECGVYQGQKISIIIETLKLYGFKDRTIYLIDTFEGMTDPSRNDYQIVSDIRMKKHDMYSSLEEVKKNISYSNYPGDKIKFIKMDVRNTNELKSSVKEQIAILRLDTDFYDSTYSILNALYEKVVKNGYIIHDDYGHWKGHYDACQKFYKDNLKKPVLIRTCRKERVEIKYY